MANLLNKLRMLEAETKREVPAPKAKPSGCYRNQTLFPLSLFADRSHARAEILTTIFGEPMPQVVPEDILFLDTETTGLSGGVGTIAFEVGVGYFTAKGFVVEQLLMHDYPEEVELLRVLASLMKRFSVLCTFNGRTFDVPLLRSRFLMNRMSDAAFPEWHADVLFPARRLWKLRLKQCTLGNLEQQLLGVKREDDLPGALVPKTYFQYLKDGNFAPLEGVLEHNKQDIVSLAQLFYILCKQVDKPEEIENAEDLFSLAKSLEKRGECTKAAKCYRLCAHDALRTPAYHAMAQMEKRGGRVQAAMRLYQAMLRRGDDCANACEALAKLCEHQLKDPSQALMYTRQALLLLSEPSLFHDEAVQQRQIALQYRYARLRRKLAGPPTKTS